MKYQKLETARLLLRQFDPDDLDFIFYHFSDEYVSRYLYDNEPPRSPEEAQAILDWCREQEPDHIRWCITLKETLEPIGTIGFHRYDNQNNSSEIGYDLSSAHARKGIMTEALKCVLEYGRRQYGLHRIHGSVAVNNLASNKLLEKNGFQLEGVIRDQYFFRDSYYDHNLWSFIYPEQRDRVTGAAQQ